MTTLFFGSTRQLATLTTPVPKSCRRRPTIKAPRFKGYHRRALKRDTEIWKRKCLKTKSSNRKISIAAFVAVPGLEPRLREPESRVLPLHHTAVVVDCCPTETRTQSNRTKIWCATITPWGNPLSASRKFLFAVAKIANNFCFTK